MKKSFILGAIAMTLLACNQTNPLLDQPATPFGVPAFDQVKIEHYLPAFEEAIKQNKAEVDAILKDRLISIKSSIQKNKQLTLF